MHLADLSKLLVRGTVFIFINSLRPLFVFLPFALSRLLRLLRAFWM